MPRFFFDTNDGEMATQDTEGLTLPDLDAARAEAITALPEIARDVLPDGDHRTVSVAVRSETGNVIFRASLTFRCEWIDRPTA